VDREELKCLAWAAKTAPECEEGCPSRVRNGLCTCGAYVHRHRAYVAFRHAVTPDIVIELLDDALTDTGEQNEQ
jgi:hypothetical protein